MGVFIPTALCSLEDKSSLHNGISAIEILFRDHFYRCIFIYGFLGPVRYKKLTD